MDPSPVDNRSRGPAVLLDEAVEAGKTESEPSRTTADEVSVAIITRNRIADLRAVLSELNAQQWVPRTIMVIDNASSDGTAGAVVHSHEHWRPGVQSRYETAQRTLFTRRLAATTNTIPLVARKKGAVRGIGCGGSHYRQMRVSLCRNLLQSPRFVNAFEHLFSVSPCGLPAADMCGDFRFGRGRPSRICTVRSMPFTLSTKDRHFLFSVHARSESKLATATLANPH
ncbi:MAG: hypothetical protein GF344_03685 [Chitinivibrionales bacterium]|nr:hypothetical protein [Chitinivibrionales bacterium]